ncbi:MAG: gamma carbonic anhydrase family protein [Burkholderiales bacterium]|nr:gamma carbonic anhydrase family protein [Burkholderiales bacterium]
MKLLESPLVLAYEGIYPSLKGPLRQGALGSSILGRVTLGAQAVLEPFAVLRGDGHVVSVGAEFYLGLHSTVHIAHARYGATIGEHVTVGANSVVHACTVGDDCVIQDDVSVLDGAMIGSGSVVAAGSVVFPRNVLPPGHWCEGLPATATRPVDPVELQALHVRMRTTPRADSVVAALSTYSSSVPLSDSRGYIAATVTGTGELRMEEGSSLWFGCVVEARNLGVTIGIGSNVQDNSVLRCSEHAITIGEECTIGHNVLLHDCVIGARVLVGMGGALAPGTVVRDDVVVAAGSRTSPRQVLDSGWLWAGRPAIRMSRLDERMRRLIQESAAVYREYALEFALNQAATLRHMAEKDSALR